MVDGGTLVFWDDESKGVGIRGGSRNAEGLYVAMWLYGYVAMWIRFSNFL